MVVLFLLQLLTWIYTWVVYPTVVNSCALRRHCRGQAPWYEVSQLNRIMDRAYWNLPLKRALLQGGKAGADTRKGPRPRFDSDPGGRAGQAGVQLPLLGSALTNKEINRSICSKTRKYFCWDHTSRRGCKAQKCPHSHQGPPPKCNTHIHLIRRDGHTQQARVANDQEANSSNRSAAARCRRQIGSEYRRRKGAGQAKGQA